MVGFGWLQCRRVRPVLWDYASERLSEGPMETVEQHLHGCAVCRRELESLRGAQNFLSACRAEEEPAPPSDWNALRQRLLTQSPAPLSEQTPQRRQSRTAPAIMRGTGPDSLRAPWQMQLLTSMGGAFAALGIVAVGYGLMMHRQPTPTSQPAVTSNTVKSQYFNSALKSVKPAQTPTVGDVQIINKVVSILNHTQVETTTAPVVLAPIMQIPPAGVIETVGYRPNNASQPRLVSRTRSRTKSLASKNLTQRPNKSLARRQEYGLPFRHYTPKPEDRLPATDQTASHYSLEQVRPVGNDSEDSNNYVVGTVQPIAHEDDHDY